MEIKNKKVMVLGGWGLVGMAVCRQLLEEAPKELLVLSLNEWEAKEAVDDLNKICKADVKTTPLWGNMFVRESMQELSRSEILENEKYRNWLIVDTMEELSENVLERAFLFQTINKHRP